jgi:hypothetical protein
MSLVRKFMRIAANAPTLPRPLPHPTARSLLSAPLRNAPPMSARAVTKAPILEPRPCRLFQKNRVLRAGAPVGTGSTSVANHDERQPKRARFGTTGFAVVPKFWASRRRRIMRDPNMLAAAGMTKCRHGFRNKLRPAVELGRARSGRCSIRTLRRVGSRLS